MTGASDLALPTPPTARRFARLAALCLFACAGATRADDAAWRVLEPGLAIARFAPAGAADGDDGPDRAIVVLRADPARFALAYASTPAPGRTARQWSAQRGYVAVTNAGMYARDYVTHVGHVRVGDRVESAKINRYQSLAAFDPKPGRDVPPYRLFDLDDPAADIARLGDDYGTVVQNLRLVDRAGGNRWRDRGQRWSEAALAEDRDGNILFVFCAQPMSMPDFNAALLATGAGVVAAQHLEGGKEAQLYVRTDDYEAEHVGVRPRVFGSLETPAQAWPVPNVFGLVRRAPDATPATGPDAAAAATAPADGDAARH